MSKSRHNDTSGVQCEGCGWEGQVCDCKHVYQSSPFSNDAQRYLDVEPIDLCPACGSDRLIPLDEELVPA